MTMKLDLSGYLTTLLSELAEEAVETGNADAMALIASNSAVRSSFIGLCRELREAGSSELALVEFGPVKDRGMVMVLSDPRERGECPMWNVLVSADSEQSY